MDDFFLAIFAGIVGLAGLWIVSSRWERVKGLEIEEKMARSGYLSAMGKLGAQKRWEKKEQESRGADEVEVGAWVSELFQIAGIPIETLFEDEMPHELAAILPTVKGFIDSSGGTDKALNNVKRFLGSPDQGQIPDNLNPEGGWL